MSKGYAGQGFLDVGKNSEKSGGRLDGWKKDGATKVWLHRKWWAAPSWNHPLPRTIEVKDKKEDDEKKLIIISERWHCHEVESVNVKRKNRNTNGERIYPPVVCPMCLFIEKIRELVLDGELNAFEPILRWEGDDAPLSILAGGTFGYFGWDDVKSDPDFRNKAKQAELNIKEAFKQNLQVRRQHLFAVVADKKPSEGVKFSFENDALFEKMQSAIRKEIKKHGKYPERGNPEFKPYPFEWTYDEDQAFAAKYDVTALTEDELTKEIDEAISVPVEGIEEGAAKELRLGSCWQLKAELEGHWISKFKFPWAEVFGPAEKAGLMIEPEDSKSDKLSEDEVIDGTKGTRHEVRGAAKTNTHPRDRKDVYEVGPDHAVWFDEAVKDPAVQGKLVELLPPEAIDGDPDSWDASDAEIAEATKLLKSWGATKVTRVVMCDHCDGRTTMLDVDCPNCGAQVDDAGKLATRPCLADKAHQVRVKGRDDTKAICETCGSVHELVEQTPDVYGARRWKLVEQKKAEAPKGGDAPRRRRRVE